MNIIKVILKVVIAVLVAIGSNALDGILFYLEYGSDWTRFFDHRYGTEYWQWSKAQRIARSYKLPRPSRRLPRTK